MDKKTFTVGVLSIIAAVLLAANLISVPQVQAATAIKDRDYTLATTRGQRGGESLYVIDNRTGQIASLTIANGQLQVLATSTLTGLGTK
ncbi:MAG: hypothetical protein QM754_15015 [Tepidisphaeraceae bacterium]